MSQAPSSAETQADAPGLIPLTALVVGVIAIGASTLFVRLAEVGPFASAFWRAALAVPALWIWVQVDRRQARARNPFNRRTLFYIVLAGFLFAGDLAFWHLAIMNTTVANATVFACTAPLLVVVGAWWLLGEKLTPIFVAGLAVSLTGSALLMGTSFQINPAYLKGDLFGIATAFFFATYFLAVRVIRDRISAAELMFGSSAATAAFLLPLALIMEGDIWPRSLEDWGVLIMLAWISHAGGQGLMAYALGHLPAAFTALVILLEPVAAALLAWAFLAEAVTPFQAVGGAIILTGVLIARRTGSRRPSVPTPG